MPVTTRSAALPSQTQKDNADPKASGDKKKPSSRQRKQPSSATGISSEACHRRFSSAIEFETKTQSLGVHRQDNEDENCTDEANLSLDHGFPDEYRMTYASEQFLLYDRRKSAYGGRLIMFSLEEQLKVLLQSNVIFADGAFIVAPKLFEQLHVIHEFYHGEGTDGLSLF